MKIEELNLSVRARNALRRAGVRTTEQLMCMDAKDLLCIRSLGQKTLWEIQGVMKELTQREQAELTEPAAHGSYMHGFHEGKESMRRAVIRELTRMSRRLNGDQQEIISEACGMVKMIEVL